MTGIGRGRSGRDGKGRGRGNIGGFRTETQPQVSQRQILPQVSQRQSPPQAFQSQTQASIESGSSNSRHGLRIESHSNQIFVESAHPTPEIENSGPD